MNSRPRKTWGVTLPALSLPLGALGFRMVEEWDVTGFFEKAAVLRDGEIMAGAAARGQRLAQALDSPG
ncbi:MAG: hypothetical protein IBX71_07160 [Candidatus Desulforudis sp.]|nr:hypothetical protein [Desulforudis sp.]